MTWLRQQPAGHNYLDCRRRQLATLRGNGGDLLIGGNATFNTQTGQFVLDPAAGRDVLEGAAMATT